MSGERAIDLWHGHDEGWTRSLWARPLTDGRLQLEGQDLGSPPATDAIAALSSVGQAAQWQRPRAGTQERPPRDAVLEPIG